METNTPRKVEWRGLTEMAITLMDQDPDKWVAGFTSRTLLRELQKEYPDRGAIPFVSIRSTLSYLKGKKKVERGATEDDRLLWFYTPRYKFTPQQEVKQPEPLAQQTQLPDWADSTPALLAIIGRGDSEVSVLLGDASVKLTFGRTVVVITRNQYHDLKSVLGLLA